jgi:D-3-phosphoglycerate dehydrogenase / 2-oxoglutarate reductase
VAELGRAFGMEILYWSRRSRDARFIYVGLEELFTRSDFISIHLELNEETRGLVDREALARMKSTAFLINTARGDVINETALCEAVAAGQIAGAGLDVLVDEASHKPHPLGEYEQVIITPHVAGLTDAAFRTASVMAAEQVVRILRGEPPDPHRIKNPMVLERKHEGQ